MKIIPKLQRGGSSFFTVYETALAPKSTTPTKSTSGSTKASSSPKKDDDEEKGLVTLKDLFNMLKEIDGLPNEMSIIQSELLSAFNLAKLTGKPADIESLYLKSLMKVKIATSNKTEFNEVVKEGIKNGIMNEVAIAPNGDVMVQNSESGELSAMSLKEFSQNSGKYKLLTNSNVAWLRKNDPKYAYNDSLRDVINNGMSFTIFQDLVDKAKVSIGTQEINSSGFINATDKDKAVLGLSVLKLLSETGALQAQNSISIEGLYKYDLITKSLAQQIKSLIDYMQKVLPQNTKTWASLKTNISDPSKALESLLISYLGAQENPYYKFDIDYKGTEEKLKKEKDGTGTGSGEDPNIKPGFWSQVLMETVGTPANVTISYNSENKKDAYMSVKGYYVGTTPGLENMSLGKYIKDNKRGLMIKNNSDITFGDKRISSESLNNVFIDASKGAYYAELPINSSGTVNLSLIEDYNKAILQVESSGLEKGTIQYKNLVKKVFSKLELSQLIDSQGNYRKEKFGMFLILSGVASDHTKLVNEGGTEALLISKVKSNFIVDKDDNNYEVSLAKQIVKNEELDVDVDEFAFYNPNDWFGGYTSFYTANIFIPITHNRNNAMLADDVGIKESSVYDYEAKLQNFNSTKTEE